MPAASDIRASHDQRFGTWITNPDTLTTARPSGNSITAGIPWVHVDFDGHVTGPTEVTTSSRYATTNSGYTLDQRRQVLEALDSAYAPFNVRFTTDPNPLPGAGYYAGKLLIGATMTRNAAPLSSVPGIARSNSFGGTSSNPIAAVRWNTRTPLTVNEVGFFAVHEIGHTLDLRHKGLLASSTESAEEYYGGHATTAGNRWFPYMGKAPVGTNVFPQWSKGDYFKNGRAASNAVDEVAALTARLGLRPDDFPDLITSTMPTRSVGDGRFVSGTISTRTDVDIFRVQWNGGPLSLRVDPAGAVMGAGTQTAFGATDDISGLNLQMDILRSNGTVAFTSSPTNSKGAAFTDLNLPAGTYFVRVDGVGEGAFAGFNSTGFDDYGSLGGYTLSGLL
ncbi:hypothetical protein [Synechococcus sp. MW101C3]|uniref:hypothetical protein n=1 Tax=Synechococcus sp. MW101C3 TaxID=210768 RepID=UPI001181BF9A|nr:hypothetical protein [Synechococcus sp. MW101C3]